MVKKTLLSLAIAATAAGLAGCNVSSTDKYENDIDNTPVLSGQPGFTVDTVTPQFQPTRDALFGGALAPLATDIVFSKAATTDGTADTADTTPPVTTALNKLAGFSTTAPFYVNFTGALDPESVEAGKSVFLIKLKNATDNAAIDALDITTILATAAGNPSAALAADQPEAGVDYEARYLTLDNGNTHTVQIIPKKPLSSKTKYIVAFSNGIKSASGKPAMASGDTLLIRSDQAVPLALQGLRSLMRVWDGIARTATGLTADSLVLSYAFTTDGSQDVLKSYAAPALFVEKNLTVEAAEKLTDSLSSVPEGYSVVARKVYLAGQGNFTPTLGEIDAVPASAITATKATAAYSVQLFNVIANTPLGAASIADAAFRPSPRPVVTIDGAAVDSAINTAFATTYGASPAVLLSVVGGTSTDVHTRYIQGTIELPDFLGGVEKTNLTGITDPVAQADTVKQRVAGAMRADTAWSANTGVGAILDAALGNDAGTTPPKDVDGVTTNVTYRYPFPQRIETDKVPFLLTMPSNDTGTCAGLAPFPTVVFVHGITANRTASALYGAEMAKQCVATVAIDLPLHGVAPADGALTRLSLDTANAATTQSPWAGVALGSSLTITERHGNVWQDSNSIRKDMDYSAGTGGGSSGSAFINLQNFARTHDNLRQAVADLLNLNASLGNIHPNINRDKVFVVGHSLGGIVASAFVAANNDPKVQAYVGKSALNPTGLPKVKGLITAGSGAHLTKLLENSPAFAPTIIGGLAKSGIAQGSESFEKFLYVFQSMIDGVDPANTASSFGGIPVKVLAVEGGATVTDSPDTTVPVFDYFADATTNPFADFVAPGCFDGSQTTGCGSPAIVLPSAGVDTAKAPLAGSNGLKAVAAANAGFTYVPYTSGTHTSFAKPTGATDAAFIGVITETASLIQAASN